jgi:hypothetical protein
MIDNALNRLKLYSLLESFHIDIRVEQGTGTQLLEASCPVQIVPCLNQRAASSADRIPPPSSISTPVFLTSSVIRSTFLPELPNAPSRFTTWRASAPWSSQRVAQESGSPKAVALSRFPCTSWTHRPSRISTAGKIRIELSGSSVGST